MNSANAFAYSCAGAMNEHQIAHYAQYVQTDFERLKGLGGWLSDQAKQTMDKFTDFVNSRTWELSKRLVGRNYGEYVGRFEVGYLGSMTAQQQAEGFMRNYIMANPEVMALYQQEIIAGYDGHFSKQCVGIGNDNLYYRKAMQGVVNLQTKDDVSTALRTDYYEPPGEGLPVRSIMEVQKTWRATNHHLAQNLFDPTSPDNKMMTTAEKQEEE